MRRDPVKAVLNLDAGIVAARHDLVGIIRMPGQRSVKLFPESVSCKKRLGSAALFSRTAEKDHRAGGTCFL